MTVAADMQNAAGEARRAWRSWFHSPASFKIGTAILLIHIAVAIFGPFLAPYAPNQMATGPAFSDMSWVHPFGTDQLGRDVLSRVVHGAHLVIFLSVAGTLLGFSIGASLGLLSGYVGGWFDNLLMRTAEALISIPFLFLALLLVALAGPQVSGKPILIVLVIGFIYAPRIARMARSAAIEIASCDFVTAARLRGDPAWLVASREILPNASGLLLVEFALRAAYAPVLVGALGFLGFGLRPPTPEWGLMISENRNLIYVAPITVLGPGLALASLVIGINLWTEGLARVLGRTVRRGH